MRRRALPVLCLGASLISIACPSRQPTPGPDKAAALRDRIDLIGGFLAQRGLAARAFEELGGALPDSTWLTEVAYDVTTVRAKGCAPSNTAVADYVSRLGGSPVLTEVNLQSSVERGIRNHDWQEFSIQAAVRGAHRQKAAERGSGSGVGTEDIAALTAQLAELEKDLPAGKDSAGILRQFQEAADESGSKITKFAPGGEIPGEFYREWPISIEAAGSRQSLGRFLERVNDLPRSWVIKKFSANAVSPQDPGSPIRASITVQTYLLRDEPKPTSR
jgi:Tfp pilus assembly protein PilO